jgi:hypothetical protein
MPRKPRNPKTQWREYFHRLRLEIGTLERLEKTLPPDLFARFTQSYSRHYVTSLQYGEQPARACDFFKEFCEIEKLGTIEFEDYADLRREVRDYTDIYGPPRESESSNGNGHKRARRPRGENIPAARVRARKTLGLDITQAPAMAEDPEPVQQENLEPVAVMITGTSKPIQQALF